MKLTDGQINAIEDPAGLDEACGDSIKRAEPQASDERRQGALLHVPKDAPACA